MAVVMNKQTCDQIMHAITYAHGFLQAVAAHEEGSGLSIMAQTTKSVAVRLASARNLLFVAVHGVPFDVSHDQSVPPQDAG